MGEARHDGLAIPGEVVLAHEPPFTLGQLRVDPSTRQVESAGRRETLEPKVMQVLVALARANGAIVTRDQLLSSCWNGRVVTDDAINRVLSRIRQLAAGIGAGSFALETITKVGYRLTEQGSQRAPAPAGEPRRLRREAPLFGRREALAAAAVAGTAAAAGFLAWQPWRHRPQGEARELFDRAQIAQRVGRADQVRQAVSDLERAVAIDPLYGDAWGALALVYTHNLDGMAEAQLASLPQRIRSAAGRALQLDPNNADALLALACIPPHFRNWAAIEPRLRGLSARFPRHWLVQGRTAILLYQVGRLEEGVEFHKKVIGFDPMLPGPYAYAAPALSSSGRIQEADAMLRQALDKWPAHPWLWHVKYDHLLFSGRPQSAAAFVMDPESLPSGFRAEDTEPLLALARAAESRRPDDVASSLLYFRNLASADATAIRDAAPNFALLGDLDLVFQSLERYFFNRGTFGQPAAIGPYTRRYTDFLFRLPMAAARADPRFAALTREIGLADYWRSTGFFPPMVKS